MVSSDVESKRKKVEKGVGVSFPRKDVSLFIYFFSTKHKNKMFYLTYKESNNDNEGI